MTADPVNRGRILDLQEPCNPIWPITPDQHETQALAGFSHNLVRPRLSRLPAPVPTPAHAAPSGVVRSVDRGAQLIADCMNRSELFGLYSPSCRLF